MIFSIKINLESQLYALRVSCEIENTKGSLVDIFYNKQDVSVNINYILLKTLVPESRWDRAVLFTLMPKGAGFSFAYKTSLTMSLNMVNLKNTWLIWKKDESQFICESEDYLEKSSSHHNQHQNLTVQISKTLIAALRIYICS